MNKNIQDSLQKSFKTLGFHIKYNYEHITKPQNIISLRITNHWVEQYHTCSNENPITRMLTSEAGLDQLKDLLHFPTNC